MDEEGEVLWCLFGSWSWWWPVWLPAVVLVLFPISVELKRAGGGGGGGGGFAVVVDIYNTISTSQQDAVS